MTEILTADEACKYLRVAKPTLYRYVRSGQLPGFKMGKIWKFHKEIIDKWIQDRVKVDTEARSTAISKKSKRK
jgi:excisionase family DNA binding protein